MDRIEELLEKAKDLHHHGDVNGALACTYEAVGEFYREMKAVNQQAETSKEAKPC